MFFYSNCFFSYNVLNVNSLECVSMNDQERKIRSEIVDVNSNEPLFYRYSIKINNCRCSCNSINNTYAKLCVPDVVKDTNFKLFNLMSRTN